MQRERRGGVCAARLVEQALLPVHRFELLACGLVAVQVGHEVGRATAHADPGGRGGVGKGGLCRGPGVVAQAVAGGAGQPAGGHGNQCPNQAVWLC